jgi:endoglucanase
MEIGMLKQNGTFFKFNPIHSIIKTLTCALLLTPLTVPAASYLRLNQVGYKSGLSSRAYLMTTSNTSGLPFTINSSNGNVAATGVVGASAGRWGSYYIYPIDFLITGSDKYTISVGGVANVKSPAFSIDSPVNLYSQALSNALYFYQNERDGSNFITTAFRTRAAHLNDAHANVYTTPSFDSNDNIRGNLQATGAIVNAEGGWWDAGDYLKFVHTQSYAVAMMLVGIRDFPNQMGVGSTTSNFMDEAKFGLDWLQKMWDDNTRTLYYQVGIGVDFASYNFYSDHDLWRLPQADDTYGGTSSTYQYIRNRPVFIAGNAGAKISPNLAGRLAADFALCFTVYKNTDPAYANQCLLSAEHVFDLADTAPSGNLLTVAPYDFYPETEWRDDLELGATELYLALQGGNLPPGLPHTDPNYYLTQAAHWAHAYITGPNDQTDTLNLYDVSGLAHFELHRAITLAGNPSLEVTKAQLLKDIANQINVSVSDSKDPFGSPEGWRFSDTASHVAGLAVMAAEYNYLNSSQTYPTERWIGNLLGANGWGVSFIVGDGTTFPYCIQHQPANLLGSTNGLAPVLAGAVVEGPTDAASSGSLSGMIKCPPGGGDIYKPFNAKSAVYKDNVQSYTTNEPSIDLSASSMLMFAWQIASAPNTP